MSMALRSSVVAWLLSFGLLGCGRDDVPATSAQPPGPASAPTNISTEDPVIQAWLACIECETEPLQLLLDPLSPERRTTLAHRLDEIVRSTYMEAIDDDVVVAHLTRTYEQLVDYRGTHPENTLEAETLKDFLDLYLPDYKLWRRERALALLFALAGRNTPAALDVLRSLAGFALPPEVREVLDRILTQLPP